MKDTGMIRELDALGRIVLPVELRKTKGIEIGDPLEIFTDGSIIMLRKYRSTCCVFCNNLDNTKMYKDYYICETCASSLKLEEQEEPSVSTTIDKSKPEVLSNSATRGQSTQTKKEERLETLKRIIAEDPGLTQKEIALKMGISQPMVSLLKKQVTN